VLFSIFLLLQLRIFTWASGRGKGNHLEAQTWTAALIRSLDVSTKPRISKDLNCEISTDRETPQKNSSERDLYGNSLPTALMLYARALHSAPA